MKIVLDIDGVICEETKPYSKAKPICGAREKLDHWMLVLGYKVILHTSRRKRDRKITIAWLKKHEIRYDALILGKPKGDLYIDDKAMRFSGDWSFLP